jgi:hypothetical protein
MKLYAKTSSERGKEQGKGGNDYIHTKLTALHNGVIYEIGIVRFSHQEGQFILTVDRTSKGRDHAGTVYTEIINL